MMIYFVHRNDYGACEAEEFVRMFGHGRCRIEPGYELVVADKFGSEKRCECCNTFDLNINCIDAVRNTNSDLLAYPSKSCAIDQLAYEVGASRNDPERVFLLAKAIRFFNTKFDD